MVFSKRENNLIIFLCFVVVAAVIFTVGVPLIVEDRNYLKGEAIIFSGGPLLSDLNKPVYVPPQKLSNPPEIIKSIYVSAYSAGSKKYIDYLSYLFKNTEINSVVVDVKGSDGHISYDSGFSEVKKYDLYKGAIKDIDELIRFFHNQNIYVIGRIAVFEDPMYSQTRPELAIYNKVATTDLEDISKRVLWTDNNNLSWLDPASKDAWNYNINLAKDAFYHGFDEINFDYIRFPSDGQMGVLGYPVYDGTKNKADVIKEFFTYLRQELKGEKISADLFGQTTINKDDMGIGQIIENAFENFDYIAPMVYPSHYINGFLGFENPAEYPYEIVKYSMQGALIRELAFLKGLNGPLVELTKNQEKPTNKTTEVTGPIQDISSLAKFRPWLQDFNMGADYTVDMVRAEIKATEDALGDNYAGFMLWSPYNIYTEGAVLKPVIKQ